MKGYVACKGKRWYAVVYEGVDPVTGRERRRWHAAGTDRAEAEALAGRLAVDARERRRDGRVRLTFTDFVDRYWWPAKRMQLRPTTLVGYERNLRLFILPALGDTVLRDLRAETIEALYGQLLLDGRADGGGGLSTKSVHEVHVIVRNICDHAARRGLLAANPARYAAALVAERFTNQTE